ncbi:MAG: MFS transporter [Bacillota bacterium]
MNKKILALLGAGHAVTDVNQGALSMMLAFLQPVLSLNQMQVGLAMLAFNLSSSVIQPLFGMFSDRFRAAWLIPLGCLLAGLGMAFTGFSPNYPFLLIAALISGLGVAAFHPEGSKYTRFASGPRKASGMSVFSVGGNFGFAAGPILATLFFGWKGLAGSAGFFALNGIMALTLLFFLPAVKSAGAGSASPAPATGAVRDAGKNPGMSKVRLIAAVVLLVLVIIMRTWVHFGMVTFLPQYYVHYLHHSERYAAFLTSLFLLAGAFGTITGGPAADRWGLKTVLVTSMALMVPFLYLFTHSSGIWTVLIVALSGFAVISTFAVTIVFGQELLPNNVGLASGLMMGFGVGAGGAGAALLGWVADHWGLPSIFHVMIVFPAIGLFLALFLPGRPAAVMNRSRPAG